MVSSIVAAIPQPPVNDPMPQTAELIFNVFIFIPLGIALAIAIRHITRGKGPLLLYCIIGGAVAATFEPMVDILGHVYLKEVDAVGTFTIYDRTMPLYICFVYPWYVGGLGYLAYRIFEYGVTMRMLFVIWAADAVVDVFLESPGILAGTYLYYGKQPFDIWGFPFWWAFVNPVMPMVAGALLFKLRPHLTGRRLVLAIPIIPIADGVANGATAWPMWLSLNQNDPSYWFTYPTALVTLGLCLFCVWIIGLVVAVPAGEARIRRMRDVWGFRYLGREPGATAPAEPPARVPVS